MDNFIWIEKYRPSCLEDLVLPAEYKEKFDSYIQERKIPNLLLTSQAPGLGKTSLAKILIKKKQLFIKICSHFIVKSKMLWLLLIENL